MFNFLRVSVLPLALERGSGNLGTAVLVYIFYEYCMMAMHIPPHPEFTLNPWHWDHVTRLVQVLVWVIGLVGFLNISPRTLVVILFTQGTERLLLPRQLQIVPRVVVDLLVHTSLR